MKPSPAPEVPGNTPWEKLDNAVKTVFAVPREALEKEQLRLRLERENKKNNKKKKSG